MLADSGILAKKAWIKNFRQNPATLYGSHVFSARISLDYHLCYLCARFARSSSEAQHEIFRPDVMISPSESKKLKVQAGQLQVRRMRNQDVPEVMEIEAVSFGRHHWSEDSFYNEMNNQVGRYYSLIDNESSRLLAYCGFWLIGDEAHITTIAVRPEYRGNSLGELMLVQCLERCLSQTIRWATLEVRASNYSAQNLYYKYGFSSVGLRPKYYQDNQEDALIMTTSDILSEEYRTLYKKLKNRLGERLNGFPAGLGQ